MFWMHGGGNTGSGNQYDGSALAKEQNVIVVTINFRLGALGYLTHPALDDGGATAQFWLRDQQLAMKWVRDNIENFGGDRNNVTIFGESYGGEDTLSHIISPTANGLFQKAIMESGPSNYFSRLVPLAEAEERGKAFATSIGCSDQSAACLRKVPVKTILDAQGYFRGPVNDGHVITSSPYDAIRSGRFNRVPIFDVTNHDEDRWFIAFTELSTGHPVTAAEYRDQITASYGANAPAVLAAYPLSDFDSPSGALAATQTDRGYPCQVRSLDVDASRYTAVYGAEFNDPKSPGILPPVSFPLLASHTHEIQYIFAGWKGVYEGKVTPFTPQQSKLARNMRAIWATFARSGQLPIPRIVNNNYSIFSLEPSGIRVTRNFFQDHKCGLWNSNRNWTPVQAASH
jgi:para-nitrobenzyl esterase